MGFDDMAKKAQDMMNDDRVKNALKSEQAEKISDRGLDAASGAASGVTGNKFDEQIKGARDKADGAIGNE